MPREFQSADMGQFPPRCVNQATPSWSFLCAAEGVPGGTDVPLLFTVSVPHFLLFSYTHTHTLEPHLVSVPVSAREGFVKWAPSIPLNWKLYKINKYNSNSKIARNNRLELCASAFLKQCLIKHGQHLYFQQISTGMLSSGTVINH